MAVPLLRKVAIVTNPCDESETRRNWQRVARFINDAIRKPVWLATATINMAGGLGSGDTNATIDNVTHISLPPDQDTSSDPTTAANDFELTADDDDFCLLVYDWDVEGWLVLLTQPSASSILASLEDITGHSESGTYVLIVEDGEYSWVEYVEGSSSFTVTADSGGTGTVDDGEDVEIKTDNHFLQTVYAADTDDHEITIKHNQPYTSTTAAGTGFTILTLQVPKYKGSSSFFPAGQLYADHAGHLIGYLEPDGTTWHPVITGAAKPT